MHSNQIQDKGSYYRAGRVALTEKNFGGVGGGGGGMAVPCRYSIYSKVLGPMCRFEVGTLRFFPVNPPQYSVGMLYYKGAVA